MFTNVNEKFQELLNQRLAGSLAQEAGVHITVTATIPGAYGGRVTFDVEGRTMEEAHDTIEALMSMVEGGEPPEEETEFIDFDEELENDETTYTPTEDEE